MDSLPHRYPSSSDENARHALAGVKWVFFDIGNVFVSDDPSSCFCYRALYDELATRGGAEKPNDFFGRRTSFLKPSTSLWEFVESHAEQLRGVDMREFRDRVRAKLYSQWPEASPPIPGMAEVLRDLAASGRYRLGMIANQPREVEPMLAERGLLDFFEVRAVSDELGFAKPDPRIFEWALREAACAPAEALMVGDRIDNDVRPAKLLGMKSLWLVLPPESRGWTPCNDFEVAFAKSLSEVNFTEKPPTTPDEEPDLVARSVEDLERLLLADS